MSALPSVGEPHLLFLLENNRPLSPRSPPCLNAVRINATPSSVNAQLAPILGLSVKERLEIVNLIWESITNEHAELPVPEWQIAEVERRSAEMAANPNPGMPWEDVKKWVLNRDDRTR
jgi:putative addiction module component (TIGR02574 family)